MEPRAAANNRVYLPTYDGCYVCGQNHPRGLRAHFFLGEEGKVHANFAPNHNQTSYENVVHGGVISALLDEILGWPIALQTEHMSVTGELTIRFLKPMTPGVTYLATAYPGTDRGRYWEGRGDIRSENGDIHARAKGKYFLLSSEQTALVARHMTYHPDDLPAFRDRHSDVIGG